MSGQQECTCVHTADDHVGRTGMCDFLGCPCLSFVAETVPADRLKRYADAMHQAHWDVRDAGAHKLGSYNAAKEMARAAVAVADAEQEQLRAERDHNELACRGNQDLLRQAEEKAADFEGRYEVAEQETADLRTKVEAMRDEANRLAVTYWAQDSTYVTHASIWTDVHDRLRAMLEGGR